jgi:4-amino-4-deoxy-L-arabinose transferase-like glycosyltransferase
MKKWISVVLFILILTLGIFLRFYKLGEVPNSLNWDEVSWGYNAYSIEKTGRDEYGAFLPLSFRAFGDFKQPVYVYIDAVAVKFFGLTPFAVRLPSAFFGSLSILGIFLLVRTIFRKRKESIYYALIAMCLFAVSPWELQFSRVAYEANLALSFVIFAFFTFFYGLLYNKKIFFIVSVFLLALSTYTYHSEKVIAPILLVGLLLFAYRYFLKRKRLAVILLVLFVCLCSLWLLDSRTTERGRSVLFTSNQTQVLGRSVEEIEYEQSIHSPLAKVVHNRRIIFAKQFVQNYLSHFNPEYLFLTGDQPQHHAPGIGLLYLFSLPFVLIGIVMLIRHRDEKVLFLFFWLLVAPLASSVALDAPNASRNLIMAPVWDIFAAYGILEIIKYAKPKKWNYLVLIFLIFGFFANGLYYFHQYFVHTNIETGKYWQYGYQQAVEQAKVLDNGKDKIVFSNDMEQGYMFYLFYTHFDPSTYQQIARKENSYDCRVIKNIYFGNCKVGLNIGDIYITSLGPINKNMDKIYEIKQLNGENAVAIYKVL